LRRLSPTSAKLAGLPYCNSHLYPCCSCVHVLFKKLSKEEKEKKNNSAREKKRGGIYGKT
jgi:hypothetical protein